MEKQVNIPALNIVLFRHVYLKNVSVVWLHVSRFWRDKGSVFGQGRFTS